MSDSSKQRKPRSNPTGPIRKRGQRKPKIGQPVGEQVFYNDPVQGLVPMTNSYSTNSYSFNIPTGSSTAEGSPSLQAPLTSHDFSRKHKSVNVPFDPTVYSYQDAAGFYRTISRELPNPCQGPSNSSLPGPQRVSSESTSTNSRTSSSTPSVPLSVPLSSPSPFAPSSAPPSCNPSLSSASSSCNTSVSPLIKVEFISSAALLSTSLVTPPPVGAEPKN